MRSSELMVIVKVRIGCTFDISSPTLTLAIIFGIEFGASAELCSRHVGLTVVGYQESVVCSFSARRMILYVAAIVSAHFGLVAGLDIYDMDKCSTSMMFVSRF